MNQSEHSMSLTRHRVSSTFEERNELPKHDNTATIRHLLGLVCVGILELLQREKWKSIADDFGCDRVDVDRGCILYTIYHESQ